MNFLLYSILSLADCFALNGCTYSFEFWLLTFVVVLKRGLKNCDLDFGDRLLNVVRDTLLCYG